MKNQNCTRRSFLKTIAAGSAIGTLALTLPKCNSPSAKTHIITLSFDDGFKKSSIRTAEIYEKYNLSACINIVASGHLPSFTTDDYQKGVPKGDFGLWNELQERGHEIMPHSYKHANLSQITFDEAKDLILRCFDVFSKEFKGFDQKKSVFNFPYNDSTPELEEWLPKVVRAFRSGGGGLNPLPHKGQVKLTTSGFGPENCEKHLDKEIEKLLSQPEGWLIYNVHGLDDEGWGPIRAEYLDKLLAKFTAIETVGIIPTGKALAEVYGD